jgi:hypothetical protein
MMKKLSVEELTQSIKKRVITRQSVLNEMVKKANDPDIEVGSSVMSLKDPVQIDPVHAQPMLRCCVVLAAPGAGTYVVLSHLQQDNILRSTCSR